MHKKKFTFRAIAFEETHNWQLAENHPLHNAPAFGVYVFCEGEATYCCSLSASSWCRFIENVFIYDLDNEALHDAAGDLSHEGGCEADCYVSYIDVKRKDKRYISRPCEVVLERRDYDSVDAMREAAWEQAVEHFQGNQPDISILYPSTYWQAEKEREQKYLKGEIAHV